MDSHRFGMTAKPVIFLVQLFGVTTCVLLFYWVLHYGGGLAFHTEKKQRIFNWVVGLIAFLFPGASKYRRENLVPWHVFFGLFLYAMAIGAVETGILENLTFEERGRLKMFSSEAMLVNSTGIIILIFAMLVVLSTILLRG